LIRSLLIANRGEVACRIARTVRDLGVRAVGIYASPDVGSAHIEAMDLAVWVPDYLDGAAVVAAAQAEGADAVHPGFGFLAESAEFAQLVIDAGLIWVGPPPAAIAAMGYKAGARALMAEAGVPVLPGYQGDAQDDKTLKAEAKRVGYPLIVKPSAGGGGKGMVVVEGPKQLVAALAEARRLAASAFGDDRLVLEKYLSVARHVEVQILADAHGTCLHLFERECSIQRRHQKVIEEAPSPAYADRPEDREALCAHAVQAAQAVDYVGAGTVEFIVDETGQAHFLEMNTRLQVEHPVTEQVTGLDIVALQLTVAEGQPLPLAQQDVRCEGWSVEARLYAEDPDSGYLPSTGTIGLWVAPSMAGVRIDSGVRTGSEVGIHYDPMLAKIIAHGPTREAAIRRLDAALSRLVVLGVVTNRHHLRRVLGHPDFAAGQLHTAFLDTHAAQLGPPEAPLGEALIAAVVTHWQHAHRAGRAMPSITPNWRSNRWRAPSRSYACGDEVHEVSWLDHGTHLSFGEHEVCIMDWGPPLVLSIDGTIRRYWVCDIDGHTWVRTPQSTLRLTRQPDFVPPGAALAAGGCLAPMPGKVVKLCVAEGDVVSKGQALVVLEAMKMEQTLRAPAEGTVTAVCAKEGDQVDGGQVLVTLDELSAEG